MARKSSVDTKPHHGMNDVVGITLLGIALLLLVAMLSYDARDIAGNYVTSQKRSVQNMVGPFGAHLAYLVFLVTGVTGYLLPFVLLFLGLGCFFEKFAYLRRRWPWALVMVISLMGLFERMNSWRLFAHLRDQLNCGNAGGLIGFHLFDLGFWMLGSVGAPIVYLLVYFISLLFLTNFQLGAWVRRMTGVTGEYMELSPEEEQLEKRARDLRKQEEQLKKAVGREVVPTAAAADAIPMGADGQPIPTPLVRDLSVPQKQPRFKKTVEPEHVKKPEPVKEIEPADEVIVISPPKKGVASAKDILGKDSQITSKPGEASEKIAELEPAIANAQVADKSADASAAPEAPKHPEPVVIDTNVIKPRPQPKKKKPMTVASVPMIGN